MTTRTTYPLIVIAIIAICGLAYFKFGSKLAIPPPSDESALSKPMVNVTIPELTGIAKIGELAFNAKCALCHGENAAGKGGAGPPLVHKIYEPSHHGDGAFLLAAQNGVRAHHWNFGSMPPVEGVTSGDVKAITAYIRALQRENGIN
ncbi:MAG: mono/diheme cytochrome c family protein [Paracoccaceae bacterium]|jgi:mono/diheme cytochrome c family protein